MIQMPLVNVFEIMRELAETGQQVKVLWQEDESLAFVARGRDYRSEFHINPSDELMYQIRGSMNLHYRTAEGSENVAVLKEGSVIHTPAGTIVGPIVAIWIANFPSKASETLQDTRPGPYGGGRYYLRWSSVLREKNPIRRFRLWRNEVEQSRDADP